MDFPTAWAISKSLPPEQHDPRCSTAKTSGGVLCDCIVLTGNDEYLAEYGPQLLVKDLSVALHIPTPGIGLIVDALAAYAPTAPTTSAGAATNLRERLLARGAEVELDVHDIALISDALGFATGARAATTPVPDLPPS